MEEDFVADVVDDAGGGGGDGCRGVEMVVVTMVVDEGACCERGDGSGDADGATDTAYRASSPVYIISNPYIAMETQIF